MLATKVADAGPGARRRAALGAFAAYLGLTLVLTWPLARRPSTHGIPNADVLGNAWAMAWVVHQAAAEPTRVAEANIYWPHAGSLGFTESLYPQALQAAPVLALGGSPLLAHNLVALLTFPLAGLGVFLLARRLTGSAAGAFLAGLGFAFCAHRFDHIVHVQSLSTQWLPLALLAMLAFVHGRSRKWLAAVFAFALLQALSSGYLAVVMAVAAGVTLAALAFESRSARGLIAPALALGLAAGLAWAAYAPHRAAQARHGLDRTRGELVHWSARVESYLDPGREAVLPHLRWLRSRFRTGEPLYPGLVILGLAAVGCLALRGSAAARLGLALLVVGFLLSLGPEIRLVGLTLPGPFEALRSFQSIRLLRTPSRMGVIALLGLALLASVGWARLAARWPRWKRPVFGLLALLAVVEAFPAGLARLVRPLDPPPPSAGWLASAPRGPTLELPWDEAHDATLYVYWSTAHWQPMVNGWGGFEPRGNFGLGLVGKRWPGPGVVRAFRAAGVRYVVVHTALLGEAQRERIRREPLPDGVRLAAELGGDRVYEITPPSS
jgi:hypothetical protein